MIRLIRYITLLSYILLTQVYGYVHLHVHDHHDSVSFRFSVHPPDLPVDDHGGHDHDDHDHGHEQDHNNDHSGEHGHDEVHTDSADDYIFRGGQPTIVLLQAAILPQSIERESSPVHTLYLDPGHKLPAHYLPDSSPGRAPPALDLI